MGLDLQIRYLAAFLVAFSPLLLSAQTAYKCRTPSGGVIFLDSPCSDGAQMERYIGADQQPAPMRRPIDTGELPRPSDLDRAENDPRGPSLENNAYKPSYCVTVRSGRGGSVKCGDYRWVPSDTPAKMIEVGR